MTRFVGLGLVAISLLLQALIPHGYMVGAGPGGSFLHSCSGLAADRDASALHAPAHQKALAFFQGKDGVWIERGDHRGDTDEHDVGARGHCVFAGHAPALGNFRPEPVIAPFFAADLIRWIRANACAPSEPSPPPSRARDPPAIRI